MRRHKLVTFAVCLMAVVMTTRWLPAQEPAAQGTAPGVRERTLFYAAVPDFDLDQGGAGILVFDRSANWKFVKRIPIWNYTALNGPGNMRVFRRTSRTTRYTSPRTEGPPRSIC